MALEGCVSVFVVSVVTIVCMHIGSHASIPSVGLLVAIAQRGNHGKLVHFKP